MAGMGYGHSMRNKRLPHNFEQEGALLEQSRLN
jgi:hypothetical protein